MIKKNENVIEKLPVCDLRLLAGTQVRAIRDHPTELRYKEVMEEAGSNEMFPPIIVYRDSEGKLWIADGHHRVAASMYANLTTIQADVRTGTKEAAIREAIIVNRNNGLPMSKSDRHNAMEMILETNPAMTNQVLADLIGVSRETVRLWRDESACKNLQVGNMGKMTTRRIGKDGKSYPAKYTPKPESPKVTNKVTTSARVSPVVSTANSAQSPKPVANSGQPVRIPESGESTQEKIDRLEFTMEYGLDYNLTGWMEFVSIIGRNEVIEFFAKWISRKMKGE